MICPTCNINEADSREHLFKRSILEQYLNSNIKEENKISLFKPDGKIKYFNSNKSLKGRNKDICKKCNNEISQECDKKFSDFMKIRIENEPITYDLNLKIENINIQKQILKNIQKHNISSFQEIQNISKEIINNEILPCLRKYEVKYGLPDDNDFLFQIERYFAKKILSYNARNGKSLPIEKENLLRNLFLDKNRDYRLNITVFYMNGLPNELKKILTEQGWQEDNVFYYRFFTNHIEITL